MSDTLTIPADDVDALRTQNVALTASVGKLEAKVSELLSEAKAERTKRQAAEQAKADADAAAQARADEAAEQSGNVEEIRKTLTARHDAEIAKERKSRADAEAQLHRLVVDHGIRDAMATADVAAPLARAAALMFRDGKNIEVRDGEATVDGLPLADAVKEWAASDEGTPFKAAGLATGGGAPGGGKPAGPRLADMTEAQRIKLASENPERFRDLTRAATP